VKSNQVEMIEDKIAVFHQKVHQKMQEETEILLRHQHLKESRGSSPESKIFWNKKFKEMILPNQRNKDRQVMKNH